VLGFGGVSVTGTGLYRSYETSDWAQASGEILTSQFVHGSSRTSDKIVVEYEYEVEGEVHRASRISYTQIWGHAFTETARSRYYNGKKVKLFFDPADPGRAVLERRVPPAYWGVFIASLLAFCWGSSRWVRAAREERAV
jgi:hypothetical protein